jgi:hypothetical protein
VVEILGPVFVAEYERFVSYPEFPTNLGGSFLVSKQNYLNSWVEERPAL